MRKSLLAACASFSLLALATAPVLADTTPAQSGGDPFAVFDAMQSVGDATLATMRGKYVPPAQNHVALPPVESIAGRIPQSSLTASGVQTASASDPLAGLSGSGPVVYFGVAMQTSWSAGGQTASATENIGVNAQTESITITSTESGSLPKLSSGGNSNDGSVQTGNVDGVTQVIQVSGNGNTASNQATLTVTTTSQEAGASTSFVPTVTTCSNGCTTTIGYSGITIDVKGVGEASQQIGPNGISQSVQITGNGNTVVNAIQMSAQLGQSLSKYSGMNLLPILQSMTGLLP